MSRVVPLLAILLLPLGACEPASYWDGVPADRKLETSDRVEDVSVTFDSVTHQAAATDRAMLAETIRRGRAFGSISLDVLTAPSVDAGISASLSRLVSLQGIPTDRVRMRLSPDLPSNVALVRVHAIQVRTPACAGLPTASVTDTTRLDKRHRVLGCATAANLAAMLADPRDLSADPYLAPVDAERTVRPIETLRTKSEGKTDKSAGAASLNITTGGGGDSSKSQ